MTDASDHFEQWIAQLRSARFDISLAAQNLLALAANFRSVRVQPKEEEALYVWLNAEPERTFLLENANGRFRMILARLAALQIGETAQQFAPHGFTGRTKVKDDAGVLRTLAIKTQNSRSFEFLSVRED